MSEPDVQPDARTTSVPPPKRRKRRLRWICTRGGLLLVVLLAFLVVLITQTGALTGFVVPIIERETSLEVVTGSVTIDGNGNVVITDAVLRAPSIDGLAGEIVRLDRAEIELDWFRLHKGTSAFKRVRLERPRLRVSIENETGSVNLAAFNLRSGSGDVATPQILIDRGVLELGEHTGSSYTMLKRLSVAGELEAPDEDGNARLTIDAQQVESALSVSTSPRDMITINGDIGDQGLEATMTGLTLENWPPSVVPSTIRPRYRALELSGQLAPTVFRISRDGKTSAVLRLDGVDLNLPIPPAASAPGRTEPLRMRGTRGTLEFGQNTFEADLQGDIDRLRYDVRLKTQGYSTAAAFDATLRTRLRLDDTFKPLLFIPDSVTSNINRFEGVSADVDAVMSISRGAPGNGDAPVSVSGAAYITNGSARYKEFPYQVNEIEATIGFTPERVVIETLEAVGPSGARMNATGLFEGFDDNAIVDLTIRGEDIPIDEHLMSALDPRQRELVETLFSEDAYQNLLDRELLLSPDARERLTTQRDELAQRLRALTELPGDETQDDALLENQIAMLDAKLATPSFEFEGMIGLDVQLVRHADRPNGDRWTTDIVATLPRAGIVPEQFPLPIIARDIVLNVSDGVVELQGGRYEGLRGGYAEVSASVLSSEDGTDAPPTVSIRARNILIDDLLIDAIPGANDMGAPGSDDVTLGRILNRLRLSGRVECDALIGPRSNGELGYDVEATVLRATAHPVPIDQSMDRGPVPEGVVLEDIFGTIYVTERIIVVDLDGDLSAADGSVVSAPVRLLTQLTLEPSRRVDPRLDPMFGPPIPGPQIYSRIRSDMIDLSLPIEHAIDLVSPSLAQRISALRESSDPSGQVAMLAVLEGRVGGSLTTELDISRIRDLGFSLNDARYDISDSWGSLGATLGVRPSLTFEAFEIPLSVDGGLSATIGADGTIPLATRGSLLEIKDAPTLKVSVENGRLGSPGVLQAIRSLGVRNVGSFLDTYGIDGNFDMNILIDPLDQTRFVRADAGEFVLPKVAVEGWVAPETLVVNRAGQTLVFDTIEGRVSFTRTGGRFEKIRAQGTETTLSVDGVWTLEESSGAALDLRLGATGNALSGPMRAVFPTPLLRVLERLQLNVGSSAMSEDMIVRAGMLGTPSAWYELSGAAELKGVSLQLGVPIREMDSKLDFDVVSRPGAPISYELALRADRLRAGPLRMYDAQMSLFNDPEIPGAVIVPELRAGMHGGIVTGSAWVGPGRDEMPWVATDLRCSGVRAAPVFDDLGLPSGALVGPPPPNDQDPYWFWNIDDDLSRGAMTARMSLSGPAGNIDNWVGRGSARVKGGSVVALPGLINLIEASNLKFPSGSTLDLAEADLYLDGSLMAMERLSVSSDSVEILGYGTLDWTSRALDLRFRSRPIDPIPLISIALEGVRNELITTRVSGTLGNIEYTAEQFGTTRRIIDAMLGRAETDQQRRLREVQGRSRFGSGRLRDGSTDTLERPSSGSDSAPLGVTDASSLADE